MSTSPDKFRSWATINLGALERNLKAIRSALPHWLSYVSVVKANAYGHGLAPVVTRLMRSEADAFAVANLDEAAQLREVGTGWPVMILSVLLPSEYEEAIRLGVIPVVSSMEEVRGLASTAARLDRQIGIHLKVDTGMGRLGIWYPDAARVLEEIHHQPALRLEGLCTHFSSADTDPEFTDLQRQRFRDCLDLMPKDSLQGLLVHADNSAGVESFPDQGPFNAARIGLLQFGVRPKPGSLLGHAITEPVLTFQSRIGLVKELPAGAPVSYGQTHRLTRNSRLAVLTAGYADGLPTSLSNQGQVIVSDRRCPIVGRVTMDQTIVDITDLPHPPGIGDPVIHIGRSGSQSISASEFAAWSGQVEWEVFCTISARTRRIYRTDSGI